VDISSLAEELNLTQLSAAGVQISLLLLPVLERFLNVIVALNADIGAVTVQVFKQAILLSIAEASRQCGL
jgi:hypothetical protein